MKRVDLAVGRDIPGRREAGDRMQVLRILGGESLEEGHGELVLGDPGDRLRIEVLRLGAVAAAEDLRRLRAGAGGRGGRLGRFGFAATGEEGGEDGERG